MMGNVEERSGCSTHTQTSHRCSECLCCQSLVVQRSNLDCRRTHISSSPSGSLQHSDYITLDLQLHKDMKKKQKKNTSVKNTKRPCQKIAGLPLEFDLQFWIL